jgi:hypothetical protein
MARRASDLFEIVVLPRHAEAALIVNRSRIGACLGTAEQVLELHHAGVREEERGVTRGEERGTRDRRMTASLKEGDESRPQFGGAV